ncbi:MAG: N-acetylmuramoyl-L-alanine amidase [Deltaproteobacteria bacterium]|nr:N-acetylmuramoyl-L-alanine amidase [Deltaproteobacteria bacterium]
MEARDAWDAARARELAAGVVQEFVDRPDAAECVAEARRLQATLVGLLPSGPQAAGSRPRLEAVDVLGGDQGAGGVRVVLRLSAAAEMERTRRRGDGSETLSLSFAKLEVPEPWARRREVAAGGLRSLSVVADGPGATVSLRLEPGAEVGLFVLGEPARVVLDVAPRGVATAGGGRGVPRLIVLDPGHGGDDWGARYQGLEESDLVLDIAARTQRSLSTLLPHTRVLLTRGDDRFLALPARTAMANALSADLFISIHLNSADDPVTHGGVTTFVLDTGNERQALRLAARENGTRTSEVGQLSRVIAHLYRRGQVAASRALAEQVQAATLGAARRSLPQLPDRGVQQAMFHVLVGARMPAVLVEASFLTEPREAAALRRSDYRQALAEGIARGIARFALRDSAPSP